MFLFFISFVEAFQCGLIGLTVGSFGCMLAYRAESTNLYERGHRKWTKWTNEWLKCMNKFAFIVFNSFSFFLFLFSSFCYIVRLYYCDFRSCTAGVEKCGCMAFCNQKSIMNWIFKFTANFVIVYCFTQVFFFIFFFVPKLLFNSLLYARNKQLTRVAYKGHQ